VLTLPFLVDELFRACGRRREDYLGLEPVEPGCRYFFPDGTRFDAPGTLPGMREAVARTFPDELAGFDRFTRYIARLWEVSERHFLRNRPGVRTLGRLERADWRAAPALMRPGSLDRAVRAHFRDPRLVQLFDRFATYNGSDPYRTPSAFNVIAHAEFGFGSWRCVGGMHALPTALHRLAVEQGAEVRFGEPAEQVILDSRGRVRGVATPRGELECSAVVVNQDAVAAMTGPLLASHPNAPAWRRRFATVEASSGGCVLLLAVRGSHPHLAVHNVVFTPDYPREFRELFQERRPLGDPTVYISLPSRAEPSLAPPGCESWFVLVNAPAVEEPSVWTDEYADFLQSRLSRAPVGLVAASVARRWMRAPPDFVRRYGAWKGSLYGPSSNNLFAAFRRVGNRGGGGLYFAGGSAHPGGGIPLVLLSGQQAAEAVLEDAA
jgi:phytoene desaturase